MSELTVKNVHDCIHQFAPFDTAEDYDNVGLLVGSLDARVSTILCALDVTAEVVAEAVDAGAELIVSHHPLMFHGIRRLIRGNPETEVLRALLVSNISLISAHTNWDKSVLSGSASVAEDLGLQSIRQEGYLFTGDLAQPCSAQAAKMLIEERIHAPVRMYGDPGKMISTLSCGGGAFGEGYREAMVCGAQAYLTGEIRHHEIIDSVALGMVIYDAGHYASEAPMIPRLISYLNKELNSGGKIKIIESKVLPFTGALI